MTPEKASRRHAERAASTVSADNINLNLRRSQVSVKLAEMIIENLADDPSKQMFE